MYREMNDRVVSSYLNMLILKCLWDIDVGVAGVGAVQHTLEPTIQIRSGEVN